VHIPTIVKDHLPERFFSWNVFSRRIVKNRLTGIIFAKINLGIEDPA